LTDVPTIPEQKKEFRKLIQLFHSEITISAEGADTSEPEPVSSDATDAVDMSPPGVPDATMIGVEPLHL